MRSNSPAIVRAELRAYADRGVFRHFTEEKGRNGTLRFSFVYLGDSPMTLEYTQRDDTLLVRNLLPHVAAAMYADLQAFLKRLFDPALPPYRRIDRRSADVRFTRRKGNVSLVFRVKSRRYAYGVDKLINVVSWIRTYLQTEHQAYLWEVMGEPED